MKVVPRLVLVLASLALGCGDANMPPYMFDFAGGGGDGGTNLDMPALLDGPVLSLDLGSDPGGPTVTVTSPMAGAEVQYDTLVVTATIVPAAMTAIASDSVKVLIPAANGGAMSANLSLTGTANVWQGQIDISSIPSGSSNFIVTATDVMGRAGVATVAYVHDHGPVVTFVQPTAASATGSVTVEVIVNDPLHPITDVAQVVGEIRAPGDIPFMQESGASPFRALSIVQFSTFKNPALDGPQLITVVATNAKGTVGKATKAFTVDNSGPDIAITHPAVGSFVGGVVEIIATIHDDSGVNDSTAMAVFGNNLANKVSLSRTMPGGDTFHGFFDVRQLGRGFVNPSLSVLADDQLGNHGELGEEIVVDNTPPQMEMDPPMVRVSKVNNNVNECSKPFDPVGPETANDGDTVQQLFDLRARIEDRGNTASGIRVERYSGIDAASVTLFAVPAISSTPQALNVDTDGDGFCDAINPNLIPVAQVSGSGASEALALAMTQLAAKSGAPDYEVSAGTLGFQQDNLHTCGAFGDSGATAPAALCPLAATSMTFVLPYTDPVGPIFSLPPVASNAADCVGFQLDSANSLPEGPTCVSVVAVDKAGNMNVTPPLRICIDRGGGACTGFGSSALPNCTGTYDKSTKMVDTTATCKPFSGTNPPFDTRFFRPIGNIYEVRDLSAF